MTHKRYLTINQVLFVPATITLLVMLLFTSSCKKIDQLPNHKGLKKINHVVVIYLENHSFDNLYGQFSGANGLSNATESQITQLDANGDPYTYLPPVPGSTSFPTNLPNYYFNIDQYVSHNLKTPDVLHRYYQEQLQIAGWHLDMMIIK